MAASRELFKREDDEIFETVDSYYDFLKRRAERSVSIDRNLSETKFSFDESGKPILTNTNGQKVLLTDWSMRQLSSELDIPFQYINRCPSDLAEDNINYFLERRVRATDTLYLEKDPTNVPIVRAITSNQYARIFDYEVAGHLLDLGDNWKIPLTWDKDPRGLYAGDRDMFAFMIDGGSFVDEKNVDGAIHRGFFMRNSEVKNGSFSIQTFLHRGVCGNHIVWNASNIRLSRVIHKGDDARTNAFRELNEFLTVFAATDMKEEAVKIQKAKTLSLGKTEEEVVSSVRKAVTNNLIGKKTITAAYNEAAMNFSTDGDPRTAWGFVNGLTRLSQKNANADTRMKMDRASGIILDKVLS